MPTSTSIAIHAKGFAKTLRKDKWWWYPVIIVLGLTGFLIYGFWAAWQANYYWYDAGQAGFGGFEGSPGSGNLRTHGFPGQ